MLHSTEDAHRGCARFDGRPADAVGLAAEERVHFAVPWRALVLAAVDYPASGAPLRKRCRGRFQGLGAERAESTSLLAAGFIAREAAPKDPRAGRWLPDYQFGYRNVDAPKCALDAIEIGFLTDILVPQELGPGSVGRVGQVLNGAFPLAVPTSRRLIRGLPEKRKAAIAIAKEDQVAPAPRSAAARARTCRTPWSSGPQPFFSRARGARPRSCARGRSNHRRMP